MDQAFGVLAFIMRKVAIFGGGQSGLQLALGLLQNQYEVTVVSNRMPEQILSGRVR
jgi:2-polyprenyl-6-methoxyphenol hydroxylase-like FAD-dependent oxidoreductase